MEKNPVSKRVTDAIETDVQRTQENDIKAAADEITKILNKFGLGMQASIQIFKMAPGQHVTTPPMEAPSPVVMAGDASGIIIPGSDNDPYKDIPPGMKDALMRSEGDAL